MSRNRSRGINIALIILAGAVFLFYITATNPHLRPVLNAGGIFKKETPDHLIDKFSTVVDEQGNTLSIMARMVFSGDELYTAEGRHYRIEKVDGERAQAKFLGMDPQIVAYNELYANQEVPVVKNLAEQNSGSVAIYHTHSDESYVPSDGTDSIPFKGGIYQVGKSMVDKFLGKGVQVNYDQTPHDPHDNNAYVRSRRTAANLMKTNPAAIFDVHRDGVPDPNYYRATIEGEDLAKLRLVIGRENPRMSANMDFAKRMMSAANNLHSKVVREIFVGAGGYNQDLTPTALLIEAGTHTNTKEEAERGISMFTEAVPMVLGITAGAPGPPSPQSQAPAGGGKPAAAGGGAWKALGWILGLTVVGGIAFLLISSGSLENAQKRISGFGKEFTSFFGPRRAMRKPGRRDVKSRDGKAPGVYDPEGNEILRDVKDEITKD